MLSIQYLIVRQPENKTGQSYYHGDKCDFSFVRLDKVEERQFLKFIGEDKAKAVIKYKKQDITTENRNMTLVAYRSAYLENEQFACDSDTDIIEYNDIDCIRNIQKHPVKILLLYYSNNKKQRSNNYNAEYIIPYFIDQIYDPEKCLKIAGNNLEVQQVRPVNIILSQVFDNMEIDEQLQREMMDWDSNEDVATCINIADMEVNKVYGQAFQAYSCKSMTIKPKLFNVKINGSCLFDGQAVSISDTKYQGIGLYDQEFSNIKDGQYMFRNQTIDSGQFEVRLDRFGIEHSVLDLDRMRFRDLENADDMFEGMGCSDEQTCEIHWDMSKLNKIQTMEWCFSNIRFLTRLDINLGDMSRISNTRAIVYGSTSIREVKVSGTNGKLDEIIHNFTDIGTLFYDDADCDVDILDLSNLYVTKDQQEISYGLSKLAKSQVKLYVSRNHGYLNGVLDWLKDTGRIKDWAYIEDIKQ